jgi:hypothetical protein
MFYDRFLVTIKNFLVNIWTKCQYFRALKDIQNMKIGHVGNWKASRIEAELNFAVFSDDQQMFQSAIDKWRRTVRCQNWLVMLHKFDSDKLEVPEQK